MEKTILGSTNKNTKISKIKIIIIVMILIIIIFCCCFFFFSYQINQIYGRITLLIFFGIFGPLKISVFAWQIVYNEFWAVNTCAYLLKL